MEEQTNPVETSPNPLLAEVRAEREKLEKVRDEARKEADRLEQLKSDQLLGGTAGNRIEPKAESPKEYALRVMKHG